MLISEILEKTEQTTAMDNMANRLADKVRNIWLANRTARPDQMGGDLRYNGISFLRGESFPDLQGIDCRCH